MFRDAYSIARQFTHMVIFCQRDGNKVCKAHGGSFVVINSDGWIATAFHVMNKYRTLEADVQATRVYNAELERFTADASLSIEERGKRIKGLKRPTTTDARECSAIWGRSDVQAKDWSYIEAVDLAIARLEPFDPAWITAYPVFKDPAKDFEPGVSLCKIGFPFQDIKPVWDDADPGFKFPTPYSSVLFPLEGIFTRVVQLAEPDVASTSSYPLLCIETSTPALRGQSGGPTVDARGSIWGVQIGSLALPLEFDRPGISKQYLNVGLSVHASTMLGFFDEKGIAYNLSRY